MAPHRVVACLALVAICSLGLVTMGTTAGADPAPLVAPEDVDADEVRMDIDLEADGGATWTIEFWVHLDSDESTAAYEDLEADIAADPDGHLSSFADRMHDTVAGASAATDREMYADGFAVDTERQSLAREYGVVRYTFEWAGFAQTDGSELHAGDAIEGIFLEDGTRLLFSWPEDYELESVTPEPDDTRDAAVVWYGSETAFVSGEPSLVVTEAGPGIGTEAIAAGVVVVGLVGALAGWILWRRRSRQSDNGPAGPDLATSTPGADDSAPNAVDSATDPMTDQAPTTDQPPTPPADEPDPSLLSNEEQVLGLLERNGGRIKQQRVVQELDWTDAKTSKVVSTLRDRGDVESFRIGRENVLRIPADDQETVDQW